MKRKNILFGSLLLPISMFAVHGNAPFHAVQQKNTPVSKVVKTPTSAKTLVILPYSEGFDTEASLNSFKIIDANIDDNTWKWEEEDGGRVDYFTEIFENNPGDDWLITPGFNLEAGKKYTFSFTAKNNDSTEKLEAFIGKSADVKGMKISVLPKTEITNAQPQIYGNTIEVTEAGIYYFGIHCVSDPDKMTLSIDNISIKEAAVAVAPDGVTGFKITPDEKGELKANLEFTTPSKAINEQAINQLDSVQILRDNVPLTTIKSPAVGTLLKYTDTTPKNGANIYTVVAYNEAGAGKAVNLTAFVGEDEPAPPVNTAAQLVGDDVQLTWTISDKGFNGERVNPDNVTITIYSTIDGINRNLVADNIKGSTYTIVGGNSQPKQQQLSYQIIPTSKGGTGKLAYTNPVIIGKPYTMPFQESVANQKIENDYWAMDKSKGQVGVLASSESFDGDNGSFLLKSNDPNQQLSLQTGKITPKGSQKAFLTFYHKAAQSADETLTIKIIKDEKTLSTLKVIDCKDSKNEWKREELDMSNFVNEAYLQIAFEVNFGETHNSILLDKISMTAAPVADGIEQVSTTNNIENDALYTTMGVKVNTKGKLPKGIYIKNGKKIIIGEF